jgi:hypothetical protein
MEYAIGIGLAAGTALFVRLSGLDRDRAVYPTLLVVIALYYVLFAAMGASSRTVMVESGFMTVFAVVAVIGFRLNLWLVVAGLAGHGLFDAVHGRLVVNPGVPEWWPAFCLAFDVAFAICLALLLVRERSGLSASPRRGVDR